MLIFQYTDFCTKYELQVKQGSGISATRGGYQQAPSFIIQWDQINETSSSGNYFAGMPSCLPYLPDVLMGNLKGKSSIPELIHNQLPLSSQAQARTIMLHFPQLARKRWCETVDIKFLCRFLAPFKLYLMNEDYIDRISVRFFWCGSKKKKTKLVLQGYQKK